ncbi:MAG: glycoside hydrolase N-terminal domain-containing protein [Candidatus Theseobacter exili]|nr:glycoside hydrolase N-terminal domain-containing protein [Candidatus Theseobacter exili]
MRNRNRLKYDKLPQKWSEGFPLGNGEIGVMCWGDGKRLKFTFDSASAWDLRHNKSEDSEYGTILIRNSVN